MNELHNVVAMAKIKDKVLLQVLEVDNLIEVDE